MPYLTGAQHKTFQEALYDWCDARAVQELGQDVVDELGPKLLMSEDVMSRIVNCWNFQKITNISDLCRQTTWANE
jgi:hypothetical protein